MSVSVGINWWSRSLSLAVVTLNRLTSVAVAPAPPQQPEANRWVRNSRSWASVLRDDTAGVVAISANIQPQSTQPTSARSQSNTVTTSRSLPPFPSHSCSRMESSHGADSLRDSHVVRVQSTHTISRSLPSYSVAPTIQPTLTRTRSTSTAMYVSCAVASSHTNRPSYFFPSVANSQVACKLTLKDLLADCRSYPLNLREFRRFMASQFTDEMVEFLLDLRQFKADVLRLIDRQDKESRAKRDSIVESSDDVQSEARRLNQEKDRILSRYPTAGSECEVNVSCDMRTAIEQLNQWSSLCTLSPTTFQPNITNVSAIVNPPATQTVTCSIPPSAMLALFNSAEREVCALIDQGNFVSRFWQAQTRNIDQHDIRVRYAMGTIVLTLALAITLACLLCSRVRWYRLCAWPFNIYGATTISIEHFGVCPILSSRRVRIPSDGGKWGWWAVFRGQCVGQCEVADAQVTQEMERIARRVLMRAMVGWSLLTVVYIALPSFPLT